MVHAELTPGEIGDGRVIVIGDVHGCPRELRALLEKCALTSAGPQGFLQARRERKEERLRHYKTTWLNNQVKVVLPISHTST